MKKWWIILVFMLLSFSNFGQYIYGTVKDKKTGKPVENAVIKYTTNNISTITNKNGQFKIKKEINSILIISHLNFNVKKIKCPNDTNILIFLNKRINEITEVTINDSKIINQNISTHSISLLKLKKIPAIAGETDIIKSIQLLPGIQTGNEGTTGFFVRGGSTDQNLILIDDVPLYNISHLFGFLSVINDNIIHSANIIKGGFPSRYGGRLSSVTDIRTKDGNFNKYSGYFETGIISLKFLFEGPVIKNKSSFLLSARRTFFDLVSIPFSYFENKKYGDTGSEGYFFYDINAKYTHLFSEKNKVDFNAFFSNDIQFYKSYYTETEENIKSEYSQKEKLNWYNFSTYFNYKHSFSKKTFSKISAYYLKYNISDIQSYKIINDTKYTILSLSDKQQSNINDYGLNIKLHHKLNKNNYILTGINSVIHAFNWFSKKENINKSVKKTNKIINNENRMFIESEFNIASKIKINSGVHGSVFITENIKYYSFEPRFSLLYSPNQNISYKISYSYMQQYFHLLTQSGAGLPIDMFIPVTKNIKPQKAHQISAGISSLLFKNISLSIETYYKNMENLISYKEGASILNIDTEWEQKITDNGKGKAYGIEFLLKKYSGKFNANINYTLSKSERQFNELNNGKIFPYKYDRTHSANVFLEYLINEKISINALWVYASGNAVTLPVAVYPSADYPVFKNNTIHGGSNNFFDVFGQNMNIKLNDSDILYYGEKNSSRMPPYHRLDFGINLIKNKKKGIRTWKFGIYNVYNRKNPFYLKLVRSNDRNNDSNLTFQVQSLFPIMPFISYSFQFK